MSEIQSSKITTGMLNTNVAAVGGGEAYGCSIDSAPVSNSLYISPSYSYTAYPAETALNNAILCEPFKTNAVQKQERSGFATVKQKVALTGLKVLVGSTAIPAGCTVYVRSEACNGGWGKEVFESDGMAFIRVPESEIIYMRHNTDYSNSYGRWVGGQTYSVTTNDIAKIG